MSHLASINSVLALLSLSVFNVSLASSRRAAPSISRVAEVRQQRESEQKETLAHLNNALQNSAVSAAEFRQEIERRATSLRISPEYLVNIPFEATFGVMRFNFKTVLLLKALEQPLDKFKVLLTLGARPKLDDPMVRGNVVRNALHFENYQHLAMLLASGVDPSRERNALSHNLLDMVANSRKARLAAAPTQEEKAKIERRYKIVFRELIGSLDRRILPRFEDFYPTNHDLPEYLETYIHQYFVALQLEDSLRGNRGISTYEDISMLFTLAELGQADLLIPCIIYNGDSPRKTNQRGFNALHETLLAAVAAKREFGEIPLRYIRCVEILLSLVPDLAIGIDRFAEGRGIREKVEYCIGIARGFDNAKKSTLFRQYGQYLQRLGSLQLAEMQKLSAEVFSEDKRKTIALAVRTNSTPSFESQIADLLSLEAAARSGISHAYLQVVGVGHESLILNLCQRYRAGVKTLSDDAYSAMHHMFTVSAAHLVKANTPPSGQILSIIGRGSTAAAVGGSPLTLRKPDEKELVVSDHDDEEDEQQQVAERRRRAAIRDGRKKLNQKFAKHRREAEKIVEEWEHRALNLAIISGMPALSATMLEQGLRPRLQPDPNPIGRWPCTQKSLAWAWWQTASPEEREAREAIFRQFSALSEPE